LQPAEPAEEIRSESLDAVRASLRELVTAE